ncbi:MAG: serine hydrolase domain-containing protein [Saprospiraceae bacterium]
MNKLLYILFLGLGFFNGLTAQNIQEDLTVELSELHQNSGLPGFAVAIISKDSILYKKGFGYENIASKKPFSTRQRFYIASISKTFIGISLMKLVEDGQLKLSTPINDILPFPVTNPYFSNDEITVEHLARHTSSILYGDLEHKSWYLENDFNLEKNAIGKTAFRDFTKWMKNDNSELGKFLEKCLTPGGEYYSKKRFSKDKPGGSYNYSNLGAAVAAYIIELKTEIPFDEYVEKFVIKELGFRPEIWRHHATHSLPTAYFQTKIETPIHKPILYPAGGMMLSCDELAEYMTEMINGFSGNSNILQPTSFQKMMTTQNDTSGAGNGIFWELHKNNIGHNGGNYGATCFMNFNKVTGVGKIFMTNISSYNNDDLLKEMVSIWKTLDKHTLH